MLPNYAHYHLSEEQQWQVRVDDLISKYRLYGKLETFEIEILDAHCPEWRKIYGNDQLSSK